MSIIYTAIHHTGGTKLNPRASSAHLTVEDINRAHRDRWSFKSSMGSYVGYNAVYDPKTRIFTQCRKIGEETMAQIGFNFNTFSLCVIGNFSEGVDKLTDVAVNDVLWFLEDLYDGNKRGLEVAENTKVRLSIFRTHPHRFFQRTECYGFGISNNFFIVEWFMRRYRSLPFAEFMAWLARMNPPVPGLAGEHERGCEGFI